MIRSLIASHWPVLALAGNTIVAFTTLILMLIHGASGIAFLYLLPFLILAAAFLFSLLTIALQDMPFLALRIAMKDVDTGQLTLLVSAFIHDSEGRPSQNAGAPLFLVFRDWEDPDMRLFSPGKRGLHIGRSEITDPDLQHDIRRIILGHCGRARGLMAIWSGRLSIPLKTDMSNHEALAIRARWAGQGR